MLVPFTFRAKSGKEREFEPVPSDPESARRVAAEIGATGNILFLKGGRMIRVIVFPDTGPKASLLELAERVRRSRRSWGRSGP